MSTWGGAGRISNVSVNITAVSNKTLTAAVGSHTDKTVIKDIGFFASGGQSYGVIGQISGIENHPIGSKAQHPAALYNGKENTWAITKQLGNNASAANAALLFIPDKSLKENTDFGQGTWYLPAIGELMEMYGINTNQMTPGYGSNGVIGDNKKTINDALSELEKHGIATQLSKGLHWSSSEYTRDGAWFLGMGSGGYNHTAKSSGNAIRVFNEIQNLNFSSGFPQIGNVMYADKTWGLP